MPKKQTLVYVVTSQWLDVDEHPTIRFIGSTLESAVRFVNGQSHECRFMRLEWTDEDPGNPGKLNATLYFGHSKQDLEDNEVFFSVRSYQLGVDLLD